MRENIFKTQGRTANYVNRKHYLPHHFKIGDLVVMKREPQHTGEGDPTKGQAKYRGPLVISDELPGDSYRVTQLDNNAVYHYATTAHVSQLKMYKGHEEQDEEEENTDEEEDDPIEEEVDDTVVDEPHSQWWTIDKSVVPCKPAYLHDYV